MTRHKSFKQQVRTRMAKTGESYTAARAHLIPDGAGPVAEQVRASGPGAPAMAETAASRLSAPPADGVRAAANRTGKSTPAAMAETAAARPPVDQVRSGESTSATAPEAAAVRPSAEGVRPGESKPAVTGPETATAAHLTAPGSRPTQEGRGETATTQSVPAEGAGAAGTTAAMRARVSSEAVRERTGHDYDEWFAVLDGWGATGRTHKEIAAHLVREQGVAGWWAQSLTVAYEQERGMRAPGQRKDGYSATAAKTVRAPMEEIFAAFVRQEIRERWLAGLELAVLSDNPPRRVTADLEDGTRVVLYLTAKDTGRVSVAVEQSRLADPESSARAKEFWREHLGRLKALVEPDPRA
ncbi:hypothetical protein [Nocardiopsis protaetiae]|uniref:hypothetical protein n=1 Tax=Nocardiopsis protaetiae TaxID=3382270 RepID=UPI00387A9F2A